MSTATTTMPAFMSALVDVLRSRPELADVQVASGPMGSDTERGAAVFLMGSPDRVANTGAQQWAALGNRSREEDYQVAGWIRATGDGAAEEDIRAVRDRAFALFREVELALRSDPQVLTIARTAEIDRFTLSQGAADGIGRWAVVDFEIRVRQRLPT